MSGCSLGDAAMARWAAAGLCERRHGQPWLVSKALKDNQVEIRRAGIEDPAAGQANSGRRFLSGSVVLLDAGCPERCQCPDPRRHGALWNIRNARLSWSHP